MYTVSTSARNIQKKTACGPQKKRPEGWGIDPLSDLTEGMSFKPSDLDHVRERVTTRTPRHKQQHKCKPLEASP